MPTLSLYQQQRNLEEELWLFLLQYYLINDLDHEHGVP